MSNRSISKNVELGQVFIVGMEQDISNSAYFQKLEQRLPASVKAGWNPVKYRTAGDASVVRSHAERFAEAGADTVVIVPEWEGGLTPQRVGVQSFYVQFYK